MSPCRGCCRAGAPPSGTCPPPPRSAAAPPAGLTRGPLLVLGRGRVLGVATVVHMFNVYVFSTLVQFMCTGHVYSTCVYTLIVHVLTCVQYVYVQVYSTCLFMCTVPVCTFVQYLCVHVYSTHVYMCTVPVQYSTCTVQHQYSKVPLQYSTSTVKYLYSTVPVQYSTCMYMCAVPVCLIVQYLCVHLYSTCVYTCTVPECSRVQYL